MVLFFVRTVSAGLHDMANHGLTSSVNCAFNKMFFHHHYHDLFIVEDRGFNTYYVVTLKN